MNRRPSIRVLLGVVLALGARTVIAAPHQVTAEMRAVSHCAGHMDRPVSVPESRRCCHVSAEAGAPATLAAIPTPPAASPFAIIPRMVATDFLARVIPIAPRRLGDRDGPPRHLMLGVIRC